jgi:hypothetical protein
VEFLGHLITADGTHPLADRLEALKNIPRPSTIKELQAFLGLYNFYHRFFKRAAEVVRPLTDALKGGKASASKLDWSATMTDAFQAAKTALSATCSLDHPSAAAELSLATDASSSHVGGVLQQRQPGGQWQPLGFYSAKLDNAQLKYNTFARELLAVFLAIHYFRFMLVGHHYTIYDDHKLLVGALHRVSEPWSARQQLQLSFISEYTADIQHTPGAANAVADALSRPATSASITAETPQPAQPSPVDLTAIAADQEDCPNCSTAKASPVLRVMRVLLPGTSSAGISILVDASSGVLRPPVPHQHRRRVFDAIHNLAHPGVRATRHLISSPSSGHASPMTSRDGAAAVKHVRRRRLPSNTPPPRKPSQSPPPDSPICT